MSVQVPLFSSELEKSMSAIKDFKMAPEFVNNTSNAQSELPQVLGGLPTIFVGWPIWQYVVTFLIGVVVYDQGSEERGTNTEFPN